MFAQFAFLIDNSNCVDINFDIIFGAIVVSKIGCNVERRVDKDVLGRMWFARIFSVTLGSSICAQAPKSWGAITMR